eukprot:CAMPEP_0179057112 /NCGR_PEP_ID=MMETSP0796-20121207/24162_1 /TAXON_ID=73915 /ORGANISM="Pyrodinium bahamense, Strain pbaha01" /LENGTH=31 /DNA_ID= /DNA_START= /DNA_END= /DNA_ORIENTATION=
MEAPTSRRRTIPRATRAQPHDCDSTWVGRTI